ncbi:hypothetical protein DLM77_17855 [Leptospira yasudae]|uniref:Uncharacterized protein n=1 Tax=Leptospira yasudae TaxID=2202201 RepID=A0ABX9M081_9LEPT|nr:hypothetical protein DLM77_17855 [Leptospira yasudae]
MIHPIDLTGTTNLQRNDQRQAPQVRALPHSKPRFSYSILCIETMFANLTKRSALVRFYIRNL